MEHPYHPGITHLQGDMAESSSTIYQVVFLLRPLNFTISKRKEE
jgi:hypothetical protein